jgi:hypothetical protein
MEHKRQRCLARHSLIIGKSLPTSGDLSDGPPPHVRVADTHPRIPRRIRTAVRHYQAPNPAIARPYAIEMRRRAGGVTLREQQLWRPMIM